MTTKLYVMNEALGLLQAAGIDDTEQQDETGRELRRHWYPAVRHCLQAACPNFATVRVQLQKLAVVPPFGFRFYYQLPSDNHRILEVTDVSRPSLYDDQQPYSEEAGMIAADIDPCYLRYVSTTYIEKIGNWPDLFSDWVAAELATRCRKLNTAGDVTAILAKEHQRRKRSFEHFDANQNPPARQKHGRWTAAALGRGSRNRDPGRY